MYNNGPCLLTLFGNFRDVISGTAIHIGTRNCVHAAIGSLDRESEERTLLFEVQDAVVDASAAR